MSCAVGDLVSYRALAGGVYRAKVTAVMPGGLLGLEIELPGVKEPFGRTRVPWSDTPTGARGVAFPREETECPAQPAS